MGHRRRGARSRTSELGQHGGTPARTDLVPVVPAVRDARAPADHGGEDLAPAAGTHVAPRAAERRHGAHRTSGTARHADRGAEIHQGLVPVACAPARQDALGETPQAPRARRRSALSAHAKDARRARARCWCRPPRHPRRTRCSPPRRRCSGRRRAGGAARRDRRGRRPHARRSRDGRRHAGCARERSSRGRPSSRAPRQRAPLPGPRGSDSGWRKRG